MIQPCTFDLQFSLKKRLWIPTKQIEAWQGIKATIKPLIQNALIKAVLEHPLLYTRPALFYKLATSTLSLSPLFIALGVVAISSSLSALAESASAAAASAAAAASILAFRAAR